MATMHTTMYTHYVASDGNAGWLPLVLFNSASIPVNDHEAVDELINSEDWGKLLDYLTENKVEHIVIKPPEK